MAKGQFGPGNPGKPKGATNKVTRTVKDAVLATFMKVQEDPKHPANLDNFAKKYPREFHAVAAKLIPSEVTAKISMVRVGKDALEESYEDDPTDEKKEEESEEK